jgi:hypothetical protein
LISASAKADELQTSTAAMLQNNVELKLHAGSKQRIATLCDIMQRSTSNTYMYAAPPAGQAASGENYYFFSAAAGGP